MSSRGFHRFVFNPKAEAGHQPVPHEDIEPIEAGRPDRNPNILENEDARTPFAPEARFITPKRHSRAVWIHHLHPDVICHCGELRAECNYRRTRKLKGLEWRRPAPLGL